MDSDVGVVGADTLTVNLEREVVAVHGEPTFVVQQDLPFAGVNLYLISNVFVGIKASLQIGGTAHAHVML